MQLLDLKDAAARAGVSVSTIRRRLKEDRFGGHAVQVGRRWKIPVDALFLPAETGPVERESGPHWISPPQFGAGWKMLDRAKMVSFVEQLIEKTHPDFIVVGVRKGERIVSVLKLVPKKYREIVYHFDYFKLLPEDECKERLKGKTILLLDDTMQRGRNLRLVREWFEEQSERSAKIHIGCLFVGLEIRNRGDLEVPDVIAYRELDDSTYRLATAELSHVHRCLWPLDENHPIVWITMPELPSDESVFQALGKLGRLLELPSPLQEANVRMVVVDQITMPSWQSLGIPKTAHDWPNKKLRLLLDSNSKQLLIAGIWFPSLRAGKHWLSTHLPSSADPWYPYMYVQDRETWRKLTPEQQALSMFGAWAIYCGVRLICTAIIELVRECPEGFPSSSEDWHIENEDFIRSFGKPHAERIAKHVRQEISTALQVGRTAIRGEEQIVLHELQPAPVMTDKITVHDHVQPLRQVLHRKSQDWEHKESVKEGFPGLSYEELSEILGEELDCILDIALDYGFAKPDIRVDFPDNSVVVQRAYKSTEQNSEEEVGMTEGMLVDKRLLATVPLLCHMFKSYNPGQPLRQLVFNKLLVNLQANLAKGAINPSNSEGVDQILVKEIPEKFGPLAYTPDVLTPNISKPIVSYLFGKRVIKDPFGKEEQGQTIVLENPIDNVDSLLESLQSVWSERGETVDADLGLLCKLCAVPSFGSGVPTSGNLLTALAASSSERRFVHYCSALIDLWHASVNSILNRLGEKVSTGQSLADAYSDVQTMVRAGGSLSDKVGWYKNLRSIRTALDEFNPGREFVIARRRLLSRIEVEPRTDPDSKAGFVVTIEPLVRLYGIMVRFTATQFGLVTDPLAKSPTGLQPRTKFNPSDPDDEPCNFAEVCMALRTQGSVEIEEAAVALDKLSSSGEGQMGQEAITSLLKVWQVVDKIIKVGGAEA
ncbi:MAG: helix-turn-helix domain-containing protein [Dehalococcoidia bacterium]|nr:helix-turn-helix domain-containing protein [Dehalococcoidia bacterium]